MGSSSSKKDKTIRKLETIKRSLSIQILDNKLKNDYKEKELTKLEMEKQQIETDIKKNQKNLSKVELNNKARILSEKIKDSIRKEKELKHLNTLSDTLKNNLQFIESKITEIQNEQNIKDSNKLLEEIDKMDFNKVYTNNSDILLKNKEKDQVNMEDLKAGNNAYLSSNDYKVESEDEILKRLLKK